MHLFLSCEMHVYMYGCMYVGSCPAGFYCPAGSVEPLACGQGQYSTGAAALCSQCPGTPSDNMSCHFEKECCFHS